MADHDWSRRYSDGKCVDGPCMWCECEKGSAAASVPCPKHPRAAGSPRPIPRSMFTDQAQIDEILRRSLEIREELLPSKSSDASED